MRTDSARTRRTLALILPAVMALGTAAGGCAARQDVASATPTSDPSGAWSGTFEATRFDGVMTLVLERAGAEWVGSTELVVGTEALEAPVQNVEIAGSGVSYYFYMDGGDVMVTATLDGDLLTGTLEVYVNGDPVDHATFELRRSERVVQAARAVFGPRDAEHLAVLAPQP